MGERVKELECLYGIAGIAETAGITCAKISIGDKEFKTENWADSQWKQSSDIKVHEAKAGVVEVSYLEKRPEINEGPFLKEESLLIDAIAERLGRITEYNQAQEELRKHRELP